ncbi:response regulator [Conexibacter sp. W3-3-2]|uniref:response regulator transcription factor n=1 Tax=Conexibacter sp. W3-3-2 TaxID=2675227 RepID=UPI001327BE64|nr:response regulator transcription factor [Conexibacter sp. W3-3-2]MTD43626.1 response regulator [Conexibacter sp. W3-3-2]
MSSPSPSHPPWTVVLADDHAVVRDGLRLLLEGEPGIVVVAEAQTASSAVAAVAQHHPAVLVLDVTMPGGSSLDRLSDLRAASPHTVIVMLTMQAEPEYARRALRDGAHGYVLKEAAGVELLAAIDTAMRGGTYLSPSLGARLAATPERPDAEAHGLSARELDVLRLLVLGHTNAEIALELSLSRRTVETHRASLHGKLGVSTRAGLVQWSMRHGMHPLNAAVPRGTVRALP